MKKQIIKKSQLRKLIREEMQNIKEGDERVYHLTTSGKALFDLFSDGNGETLYKIFQELSKDSNFKVDEEMVDTYLQDIDPKAEDILIEARLIDNRKKLT